MASVTQDGSTGGRARERHETEPEEGAPEREDAHVCPVGFCPIGMAVNSLGEVRPDAMGHLLVAGRELLLAARAVVDARADEVGDAVTRLEKIDID